MLNRSWLSAVTAACLVSVASAELVEFKFNWRVGQTERYEMTQVSRSKMTMGPGAAMEQTQTHRSRVRMEVLDVLESGDARMRWTVETVRIEHKQIVGEPQIIDWENPEHRDLPAAAAAFAMIDNPVTFTVTPQGEVQDVAGTELVAAKLKERFKDDPSAERILPLIEQGFSNDEMRKQISQTLSILPPRPVEVGESWQRSSDNQAPGIGTIRSDETVKFVTVRDTDMGRLAEIRTDANLIPVDQPDDAPTKLTNSTATHELLFDLDEGMIESYTLESSMNLEGTDPSGETATALISSRTTMKRLSADANQTPKE